MYSGKLDKKKNCPLNLSQEELIDDSFLLHISNNLDKDIYFVHGFVTGNNVSVIEELVLCEIFTPALIHDTLRFFDHLFH